MNNVQYSTDEDLQLLLKKDVRANIVGYVVDVHNIQYVQQKYKLLTFEMSNGNTKITCGIWGELTDYFVHEILRNRIVCIHEGKIIKVHPSLSRYDDSLFDVYIRHVKDLTFHGYHE